MGTPQQCKFCEPDVCGVTGFLEMRDNFEFTCMRCNRVNKRVHPIEFFLKWIFWIGIGLVISFVLFIAFAFPFLQWIK